MSQGEGGGRPEIYTLEWLDKEADLIVEWTKNPKNIYLKRFCLERGYNPSRMTEFAKKSEKFSLALSYVKEWQEVRLAEGGLLGEFNSGFCKFIMGNICAGFKETAPIQINSLEDFKTIDGTSKDLVNGNK